MVFVPVGPHAPDLSAVSAAAVHRLPAGVDGAVTAVLVDLVAAVYPCQVYLNSYDTSLTD